MIEQSCLNCKWIGSNKDFIFCNLPEEDAINGLLEEMMEDFGIDPTYDELDPDFGAECPFHEATPVLPAPNDGQLELGLGMES